MRTFTTFSYQYLTIEVGDFDLGEEEELAHMEHRYLGLTTDGVVQTTPQYAMPVLNGFARNGYVVIERQQDEGVPWPRLISMMRTEVTTELLT